MYLLGLNCSFNASNHDPSACLMKDGKIIDCNRRGEIKQVKHLQGYFPYKSINSLLKNANIDISKISYVISTGDTHKDIKKN